MKVCKSYEANKVEKLWNGGNIHVDDLATLIIKKNKSIGTIYVDDKRHIVIIAEKSYLLRW